MATERVRFAELLATPLRNGLNRPKAVRGSGTLMVNMGEIFGQTRINATTEMDRVPFTEADKLATLHNSDLLFARQSLVFSGAGKCVLFESANEPVTFESHIIRARLNTEIACPFYYFYFFNSTAGRSLIEGIVQQVAAAGIRGSDLINLLVPKPPLPEQRAIAAVLGSLDDKIELNRRMNQTLEAMAQALFKSWFVDFDPIRAKQEGLAPDSMDAETAALFPSEFEDSELGGVPKGWTIGTLGDVTSLLNGYAFKSGDWMPTGVPVVKIGSVKPGFVDLGEVSYVSDSVAASSSKWRLREGDLLVGLTGYVGTVGLIPPTLNPPLLNQRVGKFVTASQSIKDLGYVYCVARTSMFKEWVETHAHGSAQANVSTSDILKIPCVFAGKAINDKFNQATETLIRLMLSNMGEIATLTTLRVSLLPKLISGELRLADAKREVEATHA